MIDPHVHLRDWLQRHKESLYRGLRNAYLAGLNAVFEMPNTNPALTTEQTIKARLFLADHSIKKLKTEVPDFEMFHGIYGGITNDFEQIKRIIELYHEHRQTDKRIVGLKLFAGHSTGNMGIINPLLQARVYETLTQEGYGGVLAVHCEKEEFTNQYIKFNPKLPITHAISRPCEAECVSIEEQIQFAKESGFEGVLHIAHISTPGGLEIIEKVRKDGLKFKITCGLTPHHALLGHHDMIGDIAHGLNLKMNPPLRISDKANYMFLALLEGRIDWLETDHAPHTLFEKQNNPYYSGIPGFPFYPRFIKLLRKNNLSEEEIKKLTHDNIVKTFGLEGLIKYNNYRVPMMDLQDKYEFNPFKKFNYL